MIVTFYSYKGGSGRTLALANVAVLLSRGGKRVLCVDFDLEAPGLSRFLSVESEGVILDQQKGLIDLLLAVTAAEEPDWRDYVTQLRAGRRGSLSLMTSGRRDDDYPAKVLGFDWADFFAHRGGGDFIEAMREAWRGEYDIVLVDSRTGITDTGGICTIQLPDVIVAVFTASEQSVCGVIDVLARAQRGRQALAYDRASATVVPLPSRFEFQTEHKLADEWLTRFARDFAGFYESWVPQGIPIRQVIERTALPYVPYFSYGEPLAVLMESASVPGSLSYALVTLSRLLESELEDTEQIVRGEMLPSDAAPRIESWISISEQLIRGLPADRRRSVWQVLERMTSAASGEGQMVLAPISLEEKTIEREWLLSFLHDLPVVRSVGRSLVWADDTIVSIWRKLRSEVEDDWDYVRWLQRLHEMMDRDEPLTGLELVEALQWRRHRRQDITRRELAFVGRSQDNNDTRLQRAKSLRRMSNLVVSATVVAAALVLGLRDITQLSPVTTGVVGGVVTPLFAVGMTWAIELILAARSRTTIDLGLGSESVAYFSNKLRAAGYVVEEVEEGRVRLGRKGRSGERDAVYILTQRFDGRDHLAVSGPGNVIRRLISEGARPEYTIFPESAAG